MEEPTEPTTPYEPFENFPKHENNGNPMGHLHDILSLYEKRRAGLEEDIRKIRFYPDHPTFDTLAKIMHDHRDSNMAIFYIKTFIEKLKYRERELMQSKPNHDTLESMALKMLNEDMDYFIKRVQDLGSGLNPTEMVFDKDSLEKIEAICNNYDRLTALSSCIVSLIAGIGHSVNLNGQEESKTYDVHAHER